MSARRLMVGAHAWHARWAHLREQLAKLEQLRDEASYRTDADGSRVLDSIEWQIEQLELQIARHEEARS